jgi:two-component system NarL family response regulator
MAYNSIIRVLLVDDHAIVREGLAAMLAEGLGVVVVGEAGSGREAIELLGKTKPDVLLLDIRMPRLDGFKTLERLRSTYAKLNVIMLSATALPDEVARARKLGARGFMSKDAECGEVCSIISKVCRGGQHWPHTGGSRANAGRELSGREFQMLQSARRGLSNAGIGRPLKTSGRAVRSHVKNSSKKLRVSGQAGAVVRGFETGLLR